MDELKRSPGPAMLECIEGLQEYKYLMESYEHSVQQTLDGEHGNTARFWMTYITLEKAYLMLSRYCLRLLNIDNTHPGLRDLLQGGAFSVGRTSTSLSRTPVDMTLEQMVNADAASRLTGLSSFTNSDSMDDHSSSSLQHFWKSHGICGFETNTRCKQRIRDTSH